MEKYPDTYSEYDDLTHPHDNPQASGRPCCHKAPDLHEVTAPGIYFPMGLIIDM